MFRRQIGDFLDAGKLVLPRSRLDADDLDVRLAFLEILADAGDGPAGAEGGEEIIDFTFGLVPDLRPGGAVMAVAVGDIVELVRPDGAVRL